MDNTSFIHPKAKIGAGVEIGPFCYISENVEIGDGCRIGPHATIYDYVRMGRNCTVFPGAVIGAIPQDLKFEGEETWVEIGDCTNIRECATINRGTAASGKFKTVVGSNCLIMSYVHIAHDCRVGDNVILSSYTGLAGETDIDEWAICGGGSLIHQFTHIGAHAMIGGSSAVNKDVPPFAIASRFPASFEGINVIGMRRRGFTAGQIEEVRDIYRTLYESGLNVSEACEKIASEFKQSAERDLILSFVKGSSRGIVRPVK